MSEIYKLTIKPNSYWITPLQADTIWGHICWQIKWKYGDEKLKEFIKPFAEGNPPFVLSNGLPNNWLPRPITDKDFEIEDIETAKKWKQVKFIEVDDYKEYYGSGRYLNSNEFNKLKTKYTKKNKKRLTNNFELTEMGKNVINRNNYVAQNYYQEVKSDDGRNIDIYFKIFDKSFLENYSINIDENSILKNIFEISGFGKKKSQGYGFFKIISFFKISNLESLYNCSFLLSHVLIDKETFNKLDNCYYETFVKYPTYGEIYSNENNFLKIPLNFIKQGATFQKKIDKEYVGITYDLGNGKYHYGYGFIL